jgi:hypothetical protein
MENQKPKKSDLKKEISLIDLLVVLLKFRKMLIGVTAAVFCVLLIGYFIYPAYQYNRQPKSEKTESEFKTVLALSMTPGADFFLPWPQFGAYFRKPEIVSGALETSGLRPPREEMADWLLPLNGVYKDGYREEKIYVSPNEKIRINENLVTGMIEFTFKSDVPGEGALFLNRLVALGGEAAAAYIKDAGQAYAESFEEALRRPGFSGMENALVEKNQEPYLFARRLLDGSVEAFSVFIEPYMVEHAKAEDASGTLADFRGSYRKRAILITVGAFMLACFLAFTANAVGYIKEDREAMEKIRGALKKPDQDHP